MSISAPVGQLERLRQMAVENEAVNLAIVRAEDADGVPRILLTAAVPNHRLGRLVESAHDVGGVHITLHPMGTLPLEPPLVEVSRHVTDVSPRSALEVLLAGRQSIGSWRGFLGYAIAAGLVVWMGLSTDTGYLLVAAMLISPFAGPAMNTAIATARGDWPLLWHSLLRYGSALCAAAAVAAVLSLAFGQDQPTESMAQLSSISATAVLLPIAAGAAGALHLVQSERSSLVSGAAVGMLVAASLAPPAGILGMSLVIGDMGMAGGAIFLLILQLAGINLTGTLLFRAYGLRPDNPELERGTRRTFVVGISATAAAVAALLAVQFGTDRPRFERATVAREARAAMRGAIDAEPGVNLVAARVEFTRRDIPGQHTLLAEVVVLLDGRSAPEAELQRRLAERMRDSVEARGLGVRPVMSVTVAR